MLLILLPVCALAQYAYSPYYAPSGPPRVQQCDGRNPCPAGAVCRSSRVIPGVQACYAGARQPQKRGGRCPTPGTANRLAAAATTCGFDEDCGVVSWRCCDVGGGRFACVQPLPIPVSPTVSVLVDGAARFTSLGLELAIGTTTLIQSNGKNIMFDAGGIADKVSILNGLQAQGLYPDDIDMVITSHGHPDHYANINLFPNAPQNFDNFVGTGDKLLFNQFRQNRTYHPLGDANLELLKTPGHTPQDTSLVIMNVVGRGTVVAVGDLITDQAELAGQPGAGSTQATFDASRRLVVCRADWLIPGHGPMYQATAAYKANFGC